MSRYTVRINDPELQEYLESVDSKSEAVREALRAKVADAEASTVDGGLTDLQRRGLDVLLTEAFETDGSAAGKLSKDVAESTLAQRLQIARESVIRVVIRPLLSMGYVRLADRKTSLTVYREPQSGVVRRAQEPATWESTSASDCVHTHLRDASGVCLRCGDGAAAGDESGQPVAAADGAGSDVVVSGELTECTGENCRRMLHGRTAQCIDCRTDL